MNAKCRLIAYYLPQFHPIQENDEWWGKGFTEWTNVARAKPLFPGHYQPHIPADLGFYDLRVPETRNAQAEMARNYGIEGFCYYHYWFAGKRLLERPFVEVLKSGEPNFPFCLCWANETWQGKWHGFPKKILTEQKYLGQMDYINHFYELLPAFRDGRYIKVDGKPIFLIYKPMDLPDPNEFTDCWRGLANREGLGGFYFIGMIEMPWNPKAYGFDAATPKKNLHPEELGQLRGTRKIRELIRKIMMYPEAIYSYKKIRPYLLVREASRDNVHPCVIANWDNTPRCGRAGVVLHKSDPKYFEIHLEQTLEQVIAKPFMKRLIFIKSWNEWAEGNHVEPDLKYGKAYLEIIKKHIYSV